MKYLIPFIFFFVICTYQLSAQQKGNLKDTAINKTDLDSSVKKSRIVKVVLAAPPKEWQRKVAIEDLLKMTGKQVEYCIFFYGGRYEKGSGKTFLYFGGNYPDQYLTVIIDKKDKQKFKFSPEVKFVDKELCIKGIVRNRDGIPEITVNDPGQLEIVFTSSYPIK